MLYLLRKQSVKIIIPIILIVIFSSLVPVTAVQLDTRKQIPKAEQQIFSFIPHQMAKTSIFFPMSDREIGEDNRKINKIEHSTGWGKITIEGIKLAIFEEDIFLALMKIAKEKIKVEKGEYVLKTHMNEIIHLLYGRSGYTKTVSYLIQLSGYSILYQNSIYTTCNQVDIISLSNRRRRDAPNGVPNGITGKRLV